MSAFDQKQPTYPKNPIDCRFQRASIVVAMELPIRGIPIRNHPKGNPMSKTIFISLPVTDLAASSAFYKALGFNLNPQMSDDTAACMAWSESIQVMLLTHAKWRTFTQRPFPAVGTSGHMLSLALDSRDAVDAMNQAAAVHGGLADANPAEDFGFMYSRDLADPDGHLWATFWMDPAAHEKGQS